MKSQHIRIKDNLKLPLKINNWIKLDFIFLLSSFNHLNFQMFLSKINVRQFLNQRIQPVDVYLALFFNKNKFYLDFFARNQFAEVCLKQAFMKFLWLQSFSSLTQSARLINNELVVNKSYLKSLFALPSVLPISKDPRQVQLIKVDFNFNSTSNSTSNSNIFTDDFLWKYRNHIYQPIYEEIVPTPQDLPALNFRLFDLHDSYENLFSWFLIGPSMTLNLNVNTVWMQSWQFWTSKQNFEDPSFFELMGGSLFILITYKPIFPYILVALKFLDYEFSASFFDLYLLKLSSILEEEVELFRDDV